MQAIGWPPKSKRAPPSRRGVPSKQRRCVRRYDLHCHAETRRYLELMLQPEKPAKPVARGMVKTRDERHSGRCRTGERKLSNRRRSSQIPSRVDELSHRAGRFGPCDGLERNPGVHLGRAPPHFAIEHCGRRWVLEARADRSHLECRTVRRLAEVQDDREIEAARRPIHDGRDQIEGRQPHQHRVFTSGDSVSLRHGSAISATDRAAGIARPICGPARRVTRE